MAREKLDYRCTIEQLNRLFPDHEMLTLQEVMQVLNYSDPRPVKKMLGSYFSINCGNKLNKSTLARLMCPEN